MTIRGFAASSAVLLILLAIPLVTSAAANAGAGANATCAAKCAADDVKANMSNPPNQALKCIGHGGAQPETCMYTGPGGVVNGMCLVGDVCQAETANGKGVDQGLSQLGQILGQLLSKLGQPSPSSPSPSTNPTTGLTGCTTSYYFTSNTALIGVDPCAEYQAGTTCNDTTATNFGQSGSCTYNNTNTTSTTSACSLLDQINGTCNGSSTPTPGVGGDTLLATPTSGSAPLSVTFSTIPSSSDVGPFSINYGDGSNNDSMTAGTCPQSSLSGGSGGCQYNATHTYSTAGTFSAALLDANGDTLASASISVQNPGGGGSPTGFSQVLNNVANMLLGGSSTPQGETSGNFPGVFGNILLNTNGATIFASTINPSNNSQTSGFFGSATFNGQPQSAAGQLCISRPWASNVLADVIPPTFFDSLCEWGGYQVGQPPAPQQPQVTLQQTPQTPPPQPVATTTAPTVSAQAEIWAVPSAVPLGARTSVFWNTQGVTSCTETSPDGSFSENSLAGAASTVPLTGSTTYTISCTDANGNPVTNYTTVNISS